MGEIVKMNFKNRLAYHLLDGIKQLNEPTYIQGLRDIFNLHRQNYVKYHPEKKDFIPDFDEVLDYIMRKNNYVKIEADTSYVLTSKGEEFLKEQREIAFKEEQNFILKNQTEIQKNQVKISGLLINATIMLFFVTLLGIILQLFQVYELNKIISASYFFIFFSFVVMMLMLTIISLFKEKGEIK